MKKLQLGPASQEALRGFATANRVAGQEPLDAEEWQVACAAVGLMATATAAGRLAVVEECLSVLFEASKRSGAPLHRVAVGDDEMPY